MINVTTNFRVLEILKINFYKQHLFLSVISNLSFTALQNYLYIILHIQLDTSPSSFNSGNGMRIAFKSGLHFHFVKLILNLLSVFIPSIEHSDPSLVLIYLHKFSKYFFCIPCPAPHPNSCLEKRIPLNILKCECNSRHRQPEQ